MGLRPWGSYEGWSDLVRSACVWAGLPDPHDSSQSAAEGDDETAALRTALAFWPSDGSGPISIKAQELLDRAKDPHRGDFGEAVRDLLPDNPDRLSAKSVGRALTRHMGRVVGGAKLVRMMDRKGIALWSVVRVATSVGLVA